MASNTYQRKLSSEDVETGSILIEKSRWSMFPEPMTEFAIDVGGQRYATRIVAEDCECVGEPHQHYHLEAGHIRHLLDFRKGSVVAITRDGEVYSIANR